MRRITGATATASNNRNGIPGLESPARDGGSWDAFPITKGKAMAEWERQPATDKQLAYIGGLLQERVVPEGVIEMATGPLDRGDASNMISQLKRYPYTEVVKKEKFRNNGIYTGADAWNNEPTIRCKTPQIGTYTVEFGIPYDEIGPGGTTPVPPPGSSSWRTIRIRKPHPKANFHVAEYLYGPDNSNDFRRFAREVEGGFKLFPSYTRELGELNIELLKKCLQVIVEADIKELLEMGFSYAEMSKRCFRCGRKLTVPTSLHRGLGPDCAEKVGA